MAEERDWITVIIQANTVWSLRDTLARALYPAVRELVRPSAGDKLTRALATFKAFSVKVDIAGAWSFARGRRRTGARRFRAARGRPERADQGSFGSRAGTGPRASHPHRRRPRPDP